MIMGRFSTAKMATTSLMVFFFVLGQRSAIAADLFTLRIANRSEEKITIYVKSTQRRFGRRLIIPPWKIEEIVLDAPDDFVLTAKTRLAAYTSPSMPLRKAIEKDPSRVLYTSRIFGAPDGRMVIDGINLKLGGPPKDDGDDSGSYIPIDEKDEGRLKYEQRSEVRGPEFNGRGGPGAPAGSSGGRFGSSGGH